MPLFTPQFIKDLFWSVILMFTLYGLINNPIVHPLTQPLPGNWSIELRQHRLLFGIAGHNYLVLRNQDGDIISELHGLATDPITKTWKYVGTRETDQLKVWQFDSPRNYEANKKSPGIVLKEGTKEETLTLWIKAEKCKKDINEKNLPYPPLGVAVRGDTENSNSVAYTLSLCIGADVTHIGWITPGSQKNLLDTK